MSVLTDPVPYGHYWLSENTKRVIRHVRDAIRPPPLFMRSPYRGHFAVTRSLVEGLEGVGISFNYNPRKLRDLSDMVIVLSGLAALQQAIALKRAGSIKRLLAGPNLVFFPSDARDLICAPEVDICITPGPLTCKLYIEDCPELNRRCAAWPAGVDPAYWAPAFAEKERKRILFYDKQIHGPTDALEPYIAQVKDKGYYVDILKYGGYTKQEYRSLLQRSQLLIGFTAEESQGIAWAEAWSTDVPTLMWYKNRHSFNHPRSHGRSFETSTAPCLTDATGRFFRNIEEFKRVFADWESSRVLFSPRAWVLENMSDAVCARRLCKLAGI